MRANVGDRIVRTRPAHVWRKLLLGSAALAGVAAGLRAMLRPGNKLRRVLVRSGDRLVGGFRYWSGRWNGASYRIRGKRPDPDISDNVLADRIRSSIGPLEARLDLPHIHVTVEDHTALLHGDVGSAEEAEQIERAVNAVSGVVGVESYLHVGLLPGDTRPSHGRKRPAESAALHELLSAVVGSGIDEAQARSVLRAILSALAERVPGAELDHVRAHLPDDVRRMMTAPRRIGSLIGRAHMVPDMVSRVIVADRVPPEQAERAVRAVFVALRALVPEEAGDIAAVLPRELRHLWLTDHEVTKPVS